MNENWSDFEKYVFGKLSEIQMEISALKIKASIWGAMGGLIPIIILIALSKLGVKS